MPLCQEDGGKERMIADYQKEEHPYFLDESSFCREESSFTEIINSNFSVAPYFTIPQLKRLLCPALSGKMGD
ncbi:hypothetical protein CDAR_448591 [Caerostris darwini]|uniref:Uncharacterized protein n=1 Tax=Caerostris darwini TaxID=1538125 RepID=A0AAV4QLD2_9ARAC|nr:hypothetical protein CDAR_448591 [Caerostris darwini]